MNEILLRAKSRQFETSLKNNGYNPDKLRSEYYNLIKFSITPEPRKINKGITNFLKYKYNITSFILYKYTENSDIIFYYENNRIKVALISIHDCTFSPMDFDIALFIDKYIRIYDLLIIVFGIDATINFCNSIK